MAGLPIGLALAVLAIAIPCGRSAAAFAQTAAEKKPNLSDFARQGQLQDSLRAAGDSLLADSLRADSLAADTPAVAPKDTADRFVPVSISRVSSNDVSVSLGSKLNVAIEPGLGWRLMGDVSIGQTRYRERDMEDITEAAMGKADKIRPGQYRLSLQANDNYSRKTTLGIGRYGQDIIFTDTGATLDFSLMRRLLGATMSDLTVKGGANKGTHDFKYDRTMIGSASGTLKYVFGGLMTITGGGGMSARRERSYIGPVRFGPLPSNADSLRAAVSYGRSQTKTVDVSYSWLKGVDRKVMPPLGNAYEILDKPWLAKQEEARNREELLTVKSAVSPFSFLRVGFNFRHAKATEKYRVDTRLSMESEENSIKADAAYSYSRRGSISFGVAANKSLYDYGPVSLSSYRERGRVLDVGISQKLGDSLSLDLNGQALLKQRYYAKQDVNPRDADYLYYRGDFTLRAPFRRLGIDIGGLIDRFETINIDNTYSGDNRVDYKYQLGPTLRMNPANWLSLSQDYIVKIEFTDFVFKEDENYLNRTTTANTRAHFTPGNVFAYDFLYGFLKKDTGSYLMRDGGEKYSPTNETLEHSLSMAVRYELIKDLRVKGSTDFRIQQSNVFKSVNGIKVIASSTVYESGGMRAGFERKVSFGEHGGLTVDLAYVRNYGPYITEARKEYWEGDAELTLQF
jgi:hypothetical protein